MAGETILVIDADQNLDQTITTTLDEVGYTVFAAPSGVVNAEILKKLRPSLIYIKPLGLSRSGFEPCKAIHSIPSLEDVPIVILASLKEPLDSRYFTYYGITGYLKPTFAPEELIKKTEAILNTTRPAQLPEEADSIAEKSASHPKGSRETTAKDNQPVTGKESIEAKASQKHALTGIIQQQKEDEKEEQKGPARELLLSQTVKGKDKKRSFLFPLAIVAAVLLVIGGTLFFVYQRFKLTQKVSLSPIAPVPSPGSSKTSHAGPEPQLPHRKMAADASPSLTPSTKPAQGSSPLSASPSQAPRKPFYSVQLGAFKNEGNAQAFRNKFREKGYDTFTRSGAAGGGSIVFRVLVSKDEERKAAEKLAAEIQAKENIETTLYELYEE